MDALVPWRMPQPLRRMPSPLWRTPCPRPCGGRPALAPVADALPSPMGWMPYSHRCVQAILLSHVSKSPSCAASPFALHSTNDTHVGRRSANRKLSPRLPRNTFCPPPSLESRDCKAAVCVTRNVSLQK